MREGLAPDQFWRQTLRTFAVIMDGRRQAFDVRHSERMELAWTIAALRLQGRKLQSLASIITPAKSFRAETPDELLGALQGLAADPSTGMTIKMVKTRAELDAEIAAMEAKG